MDIEQLIAAYYANEPDPSVPAQRVKFGTSGHRGCAFDSTFNHHHVQAIAQAICNYRRRNGIDGPLFLGMDTHAVSRPALMSVLEVMAANRVDVMLACNDEYTPTPVISHAILRYNQRRTSDSKAGLSDGIVVTPSHNPPQDGGIKYNPPHGGPAGSDVTVLIEAEANELITNKMSGLQSMPYAAALNVPTTHRHDYLNSYVDDLVNVIDMQAIRAAKVRIGVDPLGGAGIHYWPVIAEKYKIDLSVINNIVDPNFSFVPLDSDGKIRMDPSSTYAMQRVIESKDRFDIVFACDPDHDRHGIVCPTVGLMSANHYQPVALDYLLQHRPNWKAVSAVGKSAVNTQMIDLVASAHGRNVYETPVGFKWFSKGLLDGTLSFCSEESAGVTFARKDGAVWTTDKDGMTAGLLAAEIKATTGLDPAQQYKRLSAELGPCFSIRIDAPASSKIKNALSNLSPMQVVNKELAGNPIIQVLTRAPGNGASLEGLKVITSKGWFAARPSGTEPIFKIYAESFVSEEHLKEIVSQAEALINFFTRKTL
jgi:phosphoglucomutase